MLHRSSQSVNSFPGTEGGCDQGAVEHVPRRTPRPIKQAEVGTGADVQLSAVCGFSRVTQKELDGFFRGERFVPAQDQTPGCFALHRRLDGDPGIGAAERRVCASGKRDAMAL